MNILRDVYIILSISIIRKCFGYVRDIVLLIHLGISWQVDAFFAGMRMPYMIRRIFIDGAANALLVPYFVSLSDNEIKHYTTTMLIKTLQYGFLFIPLCMSFGYCMIVGFMPYNIHDVAIYTSHMTFLSIWFFVLTSVLRSALRSKGLFAFFEWTESAPHLSIVLYLVLFRETSIYHVANMFFIAHILQFIALFFYTLRYNLVAIKNITIVNIDISASTILSASSNFAVFPILTVINFVVIGYMPEGTMSALYIADRIYQLPFGLLSSAISATVLPKCTSIRKQSLDIITKLNQLLMNILVPVSVLIFLFSYEITILSYEYGQFVRENTCIVAKLLSLYIIGLPFLITKEMILCAILAEKKYTYIRYATLIYILIYSAGLALLVCLFAQYSMPLSSSIGNIIQLLFIMKIYGVEYNILKTKLSAILISGVFVIIKVIMSLINCNKLTIISILSILVALIIIINIRDLIKYHYNNNQ